MQFNLCFYFVLVDCLLIYFISNIILDAVDVWYRICTQRKGGLRDVAALELSMQVVLHNAHELLNKRKIIFF